MFSIHLRQLKIRPGQRMISIQSKKQEEEEIWIRSLLFTVFLLWYSCKMNGDEMRKGTAIMQSVLKNSG